MRVCGRFSPGLLCKMERVPILVFSWGCFSKRPGKKDSSVSDSVSVSLSNCFSFLAPLSHRVEAMETSGLCLASGCQTSLARSRRGLAPHPVAGVTVSVCAPCAVETADAADGATIAKAVGISPHSDSRAGPERGEGERQRAWRAGMNMAAATEERETGSEQKTMRHTFMTGTCAASTVTC